MEPFLIIAGAVVILWIVGGIFRHHRGKNKTIRVVEEKCTGCQRCLTKCKHRVLKRGDNKKGAKVYPESPNSCTGCEDCLSACKFDALELILRQQKILTTLG